MADTELPPPQSDNTTVAVVEKLSNISFSICPPSERTRDAIRHHLIVTLSSPSILSESYDTVPKEEAAAGADKVIEPKIYGRSRSPPSPGFKSSLESHKLSTCLAQRIAEYSVELFDQANIYVDLLECIETSLYLNLEEEAELRLLSEAAALRLQWRWEQGAIDTSTIEARIIDQHNQSG